MATRGASGSTSRTRATARSEQLLDIALVTALALLVRVAFAQSVGSPPADDPAYYVTVARNLSAGRGFVTDVIWQYSSPPNTITHAAGDLWMPLPSLLMALVFAVTGPSWPAAQIPGVLAGAALAALTVLAGRDLLAGEPRGRLLAMASGVLVAFNGVLAYQSCSGDSSALFAVFAAGAMLLAGGSAAGAARAGIDQGGPADDSSAGRWAPFAAGILLGLAYLARSDALFVLTGLAAVAFAAGRRRQARCDAWRRLAVIGLATLVVVSPWLIRNAVEFGSPTPAPVALLASLTEYGDLFTYPADGAASVAGSADAAALLALRLRALWHNWRQVMGFLFFPTALIPLLGLWLLRARPGALGVLAALAITLTVTALLFPVPSLAGTFYHDAGAFAPWLAVGWVYLLGRAMRGLAACRRWRRDLLGPAYGVLLVVTVAQLAMAAGAVSGQHRAEARRLDEVAGYLTRSSAAPVISTSPYNLNYRTNLPGLMLPVSQEPSVVRALARRYGARYVAVLGRSGLYPDALADAPACPAAGSTGSGFCLSGQGDGWRVYLIE